MTLFTRGNAAKQWILQELDQKFGQMPVRILDVGCGDARVWSSYLETHPAMELVGVDTDAKAIQAGKDFFRHQRNVDIRQFDAQKPIDGEQYDAAVALSAIEHVVDRPAFIRTVWTALKQQGVVYFNYDDGHFRSLDLKERLMVPVSQLLAACGVEGPYMKHVDDALFRRQVEQQGFVVCEVRKHNINSMKRFMRGATDEGLHIWFEAEDRLNALYSPEKLDSIMWSTTVVGKKP